MSVTPLPYPILASFWSFSRLFFSYLSGRQLSAQLPKSRFHAGLRGGGWRFRELGGEGSKELRKAG
ncbi:hypothetical protein CCP4SC76_1210001 [Gammaproteobacteria bacterium]